MCKHLDTADYASGSHKEDIWSFCSHCSASPPGMRFWSGNEQAPSSADCILCAGVGHLALQCSLHSAKCRFWNGDLTSKIDNWRICFAFNTAKGCIKGCEHHHVCSICLTSTHGAQKCSNIIWFHPNALTSRCLCNCSVQLLLDALLPFSHSSHCSWVSDWFEYAFCFWEFYPAQSL